ncbi:MAG: hypothetical protein K0R15_2 [Clostridiales bacterium]|nr:hypothetical protein [Herbinix sp.]MDF2819561.1 hypothetical protein [Clostridiales bacterium]
MMKAIFIDRDGTLGGGESVIFPKEFQPYTNVLESIQLLKDNGYKVIAFTNQPDISKGKVSINEFEEELFQFGFDDLCICPHQNSDGCKCRKPSAAMLLSMIAKYNLKIEECYVIGDRWSDMLAGLRAGMNVILVKTGSGNDALSKYQDKWNMNSAAYIAIDINDAANWITLHI